MTVKIKKRGYKYSFPDVGEFSKDLSPMLKKKKVNASTNTESLSIPTSPPSHPCPMGTHVSIPATVCYEGEGILVVQVQWRGKTYVGTLINSGNQNRGIKFVEMSSDDRNIST